MHVMTIVTFFPAGKIKLDFLEIYGAKSKKIQAAFYTSKLFQEKSKESLDYFSPRHNVIFLPEVG